MDLCFHWHLLQQQGFSELFYCSVHLDTRQFLGICHCFLPSLEFGKLCWYVDLQPIKDQTGVTAMWNWKNTVAKWSMEKYKEICASEYNPQTNSVNTFMLRRQLISYFNSKKGSIYKEVGAFIKYSIRLWYIFCFLNFFLYSHSSSKINSLKPV